LARVLPFGEQFVAVAQDEVSIWNQACRRLGAAPLPGARIARDAAVGAGRLAIVAEYFSSTEIWLTGDDLCRE
jgi:hypothetical protein